ncbi:MAG: ferritin-like domain-containing protein [Myxococcales bacterium]|nr:ferritin-like domain-containing protein [Myxococcales bacterium]
MQYTQRNPVPMPESGAYSSVKATIDTVFDWQYALEDQKLMALYEKGKTATWNASDIDWTQEVDIAKLATETRADLFMNSLMAPPKPFTLETAIEFRLHMNAFMLSQFLHGEQGALIATAKIVQTVPWEEAKFYAANQVADEARHVEVYHRYLTEKLGLSYPVHPSLGELLDSVVSDSRWDVTYLGMQILVEGLALAAFGTMRLVNQNEPLIQDITDRIMQDEARHVAFGVISLQKLYHGGLTSQELREREDFVIEATYLLRDRLLGTPVFDRLGWDKSIWVPWMMETPFQQGFRQMMFSKIVPNLNRLGLLTPRVREAFDKLGILRFEHDKDSVEEPGVAPPEELVQMMMQYMAERVPTAE